MLPLSRQHKGSLCGPMKWAQWEEEAQGSGRSFPAGESKRSGLCGDEAAVLARKASALQGTAPRQAPPSGGCPGSMAQALRPAAPFPDAAAPQDGAVSHLAQWPVQIKLVPVEAPWFNGARLLIAADCTAYARADFHRRFMRGRVTLIGCPQAG